MSQFCGQIFTIFVLLGWLTEGALAHGFDCNTPPISFIDPVSHDFSVIDDSGSGITWGRLDTCPISQNISGGVGDVACVGGSSIEVQSTMESLEAYIGCRSVVTVKFKLNFQNPNQASSLVLSALPSGQNQWSPVSTWNSSVGTIIQGEEIQIDLSGFSTDGFSPFKLRWEFMSPAGDSSIVQIDDVALTCIDAEKADVDVTIVGEIGPIPTGAIRRYKIVGQNLGPVVTSVTNLSSNVTTPGKIIGTSGAFLSAQSVGFNDVSLSIEQQPPGIITESFVDVRFLNLGDTTSVVIPVTAQIESDKCDFRLINNKRQRIVTAENNETSVKFPQDLLKITKLNLKLKKFASCKGSSHGIKGIFGKISSPSARERLKSMAPDYATSLLLNLNKTAIATKKIAQGQVTCGSQTSKSAYKNSNKYLDQLTKLFVN